MWPHYSDTYEGCVNGCDSTLSEILQVNISRPSFSSTSNTQSLNRNSEISQNRGKIINKYILF